MRASLAELAADFYLARMTYDELSKLLNAEPYIPFILRTVDGRAFLIDNPDYTSWTYDRQKFNFNDYGAHTIRLPLDSIAGVELSGVPQAA